MSKNSSQTNLNAFNSSIKKNSHADRGSVFNSIARDVLTQSTADLQNFEREESKNGLANQKLTIRQSYNDQQVQPSYREYVQAQNKNSDDRLNFDEFLSEYEQKKKAERERSPGEHRSKYFNDVFNSKLSIGAKNEPMSGRIIREIEPKTQRTHYEGNHRYTNVLQGEYNAKPELNGTVAHLKFIAHSYIPDIPQSFKKTIDEKEIYKPTNRYKHWTPNIRNLDSTYEVKDVGVSSSNPSMRMQFGGKKLYEVHR